MALTWIADSMDQRSGQSHDAQHFAQVPSTSLEPSAFSSVDLLPEIAHTWNGPSLDDIIFGLDQNLPEIPISFNLLEH